VIEHYLAIRIEIVEIQMSVGVDQRHDQAS
jgi:hypothetical protein